MTAEQFKVLRPTMLNPLGQAFAFMPKEVQDGMTASAGHLQQLVKRGQEFVSYLQDPITDNDCGNVIRIDPSWSGPSWTPPPNAPTKPETVDYLVFEHCLSQKFTHANGTIIKPHRRDESCMEGMKACKCLPVRARKEPKSVTANQ